MFFVAFSFLQSLLTNARVVPYFLDCETHKDFGWQIYFKLEDPVHKLSFKKMAVEYEFPTAYRIP
jgi:hypothetical protein